MTSGVSINQSDSSIPSARLLFPAVNDGLLLRDGRISNMEVRLLVRSEDLMEGVRVKSSRYRELDNYDNIRISSG